MKKNNENSARERAFKWLSANFLVERATERPPFAQKDQWPSFVQCQLKPVDPPILRREKRIRVDKKQKPLVLTEVLILWVTSDGHNDPNVSTENLNEESWKECLRPDFRKCTLSPNSHKFLSICSTSCLQANDPCLIQFCTNSPPRYEIRSKVSKACLGMI